MKSRNHIFLFIALCLLYAGACRLAIPSPGRHLFKVLPILLLLADSLVRAWRTKDKSRMLMSAALLFSAAGDVSGTFVTMGLFFAVAHCFYTASYSRHFCLKTPKQLMCIAVLLAVVGLTLFLVIPKLLGTRLMVAVCIYIFILMTMSFTAISQSRPYWLLFAAGSLLFVISDCSIFLDNYAIDIPSRHLVVMSTYYSSQLLMNLK